MQKEKKTKILRFACNTQWVVVEGTGPAASDNYTKVVDIRKVSQKVFDEFLKNIRN